MKDVKTISVFLREQRRYTQNELVTMFEYTEEKTVKILKKLKEYGVLKAVKISNKQRSLTDLIDEDVEIADVQVGKNEYLYVFTFVGVLVIGNLILKCYPKYIFNTDEPKIQLKQVLKVIEKCNKKEQIIKLQNESMDNTSFNLLATILYLLHDYYEYGIYTNTENVVETDGSGYILWDKTINNTFALISNNRPYYPELITSKRGNNNFDFFKRLHQCILTKCTKELEEADLLDLFDILGVDLTNETIEDFGEDDYILDKIQKELTVQFNTRKQSVLKAIYAYITHKGSLKNANSFNIFGTNSFNLVWEKVCTKILDNQLDKALSTLELSIPLIEDYTNFSTLKSIIDKPQWIGKNIPKKEAKDTLIPDLISIYKNNHNEYQFIIFDAKYYNLQLEKDKPLRGNPGIESVTKQYLYQLAYKNFIDKHKFQSVKNCFLMPTESTNIINKGVVQMKMFRDLKLEDIQIRLLPAERVYDIFLRDEKLDVAELDL